MMRADFLALLARVRHLSDELLPAKNPTATYSSGEVMRMCAFRLSAHAELESFLEGCAEHLLLNLAQKNDGGRLSSRMQKRILFHKTLGESFPPKSITVTIPNNSRSTIKGILNKAQSHIDGNNGMSEKDILKMFVPLGFDLAFFREGQMAALNLLAKARGEAAHKSWLNQSMVQPDPASERSRLVLPLLTCRSVVDEVQRLEGM